MHERSRGSLRCPGFPRHLRGPAQARSGELPEGFKSPSLKSANNNISPTP
jgi:hypothetical protein